MSADLVPAEAARLAELKAIVTDGLNTFVTVGRALAEIRDSRLYRATHGTFEAFCESQWGLTRTRAYELISASETVESMSGIPDIEPPKNETQARELRGLLPDTAAEVMRKAHDDTAGRVTASAIRDARRAVAPKPAPSASPLADKIAAELSAADGRYAEQAEKVVPPCPDPAESSQAVADWIESSQAVKDSGYLREFFRTLSRADDFLRFDPERLAHLLSADDTAIVTDYAASVARFADTLRRGRTGLRVVHGGH